MYIDKKLIILYNEHMRSNLLLYPEIFNGVFMGEAMRDALARGAEELAQSTPFNDNVPVSVVIRTRNDASNIERLANELNEQDYAGSVELVLVDTESTDGTVSAARSAGISVTHVPITQAEFTYPKSLNRGFRAAGADRIFSTVGHANFSNVQTLRGIARSLEAANVVAAYGVSLPGFNASRTERLTSFGALPDLKKGAHRIRKAGIGVLGATNAAVSKAAWEEFDGFDERFAAGGEDTDLARRMLAVGCEIIWEPTLAVHHSHGLCLLNTIKQFRHWMRVAGGPQNFDSEDLLKRRPDLSS